MPLLSYSSSTAKKDMMSKYEEMGIQLSGLVENIVGKEEIARYVCLFLMCQNEYLWSER